MRTLPARLSFSVQTRIYKMQYDFHIAKMSVQYVRVTRNGWSGMLIRPQTTVQEAAKLGP